MKGESLFLMCLIFLGILLGGLSVLALTSSKLCEQAVEIGNVEDMAVYCSTSTIIREWKKGEEQ